MGCGEGVSPPHSGRVWGGAVVYFNRNVNLFTGWTTTVTVYCWRLVGSTPLTREGAVTPPQKIWDFFHLKWLMLVQIQLYFNRNVRQFTARTTTVTCTGGRGGSI